MTRIICSMLLCFLLQLAQAQQKFPINTGGLVATENWMDQPQRVEFGFAAKLPKAASLKQFCPIAGDQGMLATCTGRSVAYGARSILYAVENNISGAQAVSAVAFSPMYLFNSLKGNSQPLCDYGVELGQALDFLVKIGAVSNKDFQLACDEAVTDKMNSAAKKYRVNGYRHLFSYTSPDAADKVNPVKEALAAGLPVVCNILTYFPPKSALESKSYEPSFWFVTNVWHPTNTEVDATKSEISGPHNVVIVGYDDEKFGGAFEIMNSYGDSWGDKGFFWISYQDFYKVGNVGFSVY